MSAKINRPPTGEPWVWLSRELLRSDAWRNVGGKARRFVDFLLIEHMSRGGKHNGDLKAPYRQLNDFGIRLADIRTVIAETEGRGLVDCHRGGMRVATTYGLTWLPLPDGTPASNRWRGYQEPIATHVRKKRKSASDGGSRAASDGGSRLAKSAYDGGSRLPLKSASDGGSALKKTLTRAADVTSEQEVRGARRPGSTPALTPLALAAADEPELPAFLDRRPAAARAA
jgi:hypothetical protein